MSVRSLNLSTSLALILACTPTMAQIVSDGQPPDPGDSLASSVDKYSVDNLGDIAFDGATPDNYFLTRHQGRIVGLKFLSTSMDTAVDYGPDSALRGDAYWDEYGLGTYYIALGGSPSVNQIWHTNFTNGEHRQITDGGCIPGVSGLSRDQECVYKQPIASSVNRIAFIQEILDYDPDTPGMQIPETVQKQLIVGANGNLRAALYVNPIPEHMDWSPDGNWLVYAQGGRLVVVALTDTNRVGITECELWDDVQTQMKHPEWAWDGGLWIVYETASNIWRVPVQKPRGRNVCPRLQLNRKEQLTDSAFEDDEPQWMNYSNLIAFRSRRPLNDADTSNNRRIWALQPGQNVPRPVVVMPYSIGNTDWQRVRETPNDQKTKDAIGNAHSQGGD